MFSLAFLRCSDRGDRVWQFKVCLCGTLYVLDLFFSGQKLYLYKYLYSRTLNSQTPPPGNRQHLGTDTGQQGRGPGLRLGSLSQGRGRVPASSPPNPRRPRWPEDDPPSRCRFANELHQPRGTLRLGGSGTQGLIPERVSYGGS
jgi:hypothetical protein